MTRKAHVLVREAPWYRREAFTKGLAAAGFEVFVSHPMKASPGDVLVTWNRYGENHSLALQFERDGGTVLVAENGYIGAGGVPPKFSVHPHGPTADDYYALSKNGHNGSGVWPEGGPERWDGMNIELAPWRTGGGHILICGQRGIGSPTMASPPDWNERAAALVRRRTKREVRIRPHPGNKAPKRPLEEDLKGAQACVIWSSGSGVRALTLGIPVVYDAPHWICSAGARPLREMGGWEDQLLTDDAARLAALRRMAWAQWKVSELFSGEPFKLLLGAA